MPLVLRYAFINSPLRQKKMPNKTTSHSDAWLFKSKNVKENTHLRNYELWYLNERLQEKLADQVYTTSSKWNYEWIIIVWLSHTGDVL